MPQFAPNKYVITKDRLGKDYTEYLNVPDMERVIEVSETQAEQVMRKQYQWIEVKHEKEIKETTKEVLVEKTVLEKVEEAFKQRGRPRADSLKVKK